MDPNKPIFYELLKRKHRQDVVNGERNYRLLHEMASGVKRVKWYDRFLSRMGTVLVNFGLRLEERCALCGEQILGEKNQSTSVLERK